jgi:uncharacterized membrane protein YedE/YeeE
MVGAIGVVGAAQLAIRRLRRPRFGATFPAPPPFEIDARLLLGSTLFGLGWGVGGFCPGPALVAAAAGMRAALIFVAAMIGGMFLFRFVDEKPPQGSSNPSDTTHLL